MGGSNEGILARGMTVFEAMNDLFTCLFEAGLARQDVCRQKVICLRVRPPVAAPVADCLCSRMNAGVMYDFASIFFVGCEIYCVSQRPSNVFDLGCDMRIMLNCWPWGF